MEINNAVFSLLQEALFGKRALLNIDTEKEIFWKRVYKEMSDQAVLGVTSVIVKNHQDIPLDIQRSWNDMQRLNVLKYVQKLALQSEACELIKSYGIDVVVIKGAASACYYPIPEHRTMGDIDLLIRPGDYKQAIDILKTNGYLLQGKEGARYHTVFTKYNILIELHQSPASIHKDRHGEIVKEYILNGLNFIEVNKRGQDEFPMLPWKQNGMELIWHIRQHLYNGVGLRHILDWMMFVNENLDDKHYAEYKPDLQRCGLDQLAIHVTRMCQKYLGLRTKNITWCSEADMDVCDKLMKFIMGQGDFGKKKEGNDKAVKVFTGYNSPRLILGKLQEIGISEWNHVNAFPFLEKFAWVYGGVFAVKTALQQKKDLCEVVQNVYEGRRRAQMFGRLYSTTGRGLLRSIIGILSESKFAYVLKKGFDIASHVEYKVTDVYLALTGKRMPNAKERKQVARNVTFIYKSFNRQNMAIELYKNIRRYYPEAQVIIADDSRVPLQLRGERLSVVNLPFNTGLSHGLNQALKLVTTPYVVRLDDDHLLTRKTCIGGQLEFLNKHSEVDLVGFGALNAMRWNSPRENIRRYYSQGVEYVSKLVKYPHMMKIDQSHVVVAKAPNRFIVRTEKLREVGYDSNIRMIDHDDFFYRAAGNIVSVVAENTWVFHRDNPFDKNYKYYRNDIKGDLEYISKRRRGY